MGSIAHAHAPRKDYFEVFLIISILLYKPVSCGLPVRTWALVFQQPKRPELFAENSTSPESANPVW
jgi:hypothetical protein